jgi:hypothetical protein
MHWPEVEKSGRFRARFDGARFIKGVPFDQDTEVEEQLFFLMGTEGDANSLAVGSGDLVKSWETKPCWSPCLLLDKVG